MFGDVSLRAHAWCVHVSVCLCVRAQCLAVLAGGGTRMSAL